MKLLAFESSAKAASVALLDGARLVGETYQNSGQTHSRTLMKLAQDLLANCDWTVADLQAVACAIGPGSFTGLRIGLAAAKGLCWGARLPFCGVSTLEAMAYSAAHLDGILCPVMDARRSQVYTAVFETLSPAVPVASESQSDALLPDAAIPEVPAPRRLAPDQAISLEQLADLLAPLERPVWFVGDGATLAYTALASRLAAPRLLPEHLRQQRATGVALVARVRLERGESDDPALAVPNYLRLPQAERERLARLAEEGKKDEFPPNPAQSSGEEIGR